MNGIHEVVGSIPISSTSKFKHLGNPLSAFFMAFEACVPSTILIPKIMLREPRLLHAFMLKTQMRIPFGNIDIQASPHYIPALKKRFQSDETGHVLPRDLVYQIGG